VILNNQNTNWFARIHIQFDAATLSAQAAI